MPKAEKRCPLPCSLCGRLDIPVKDSAIRWGIAKPGDTFAVCYGYATPCKKGLIHPCEDCVLYAPKPFPVGWAVGEVKYQDKTLGRIPVPDKNDSDDPEGTMGHIGREVLMRLLEQNKVPVGVPPQEWILWTLRGIGIAMCGRRNEGFEEQIMKRHLRHYGAIFGMEKLIEFAGGPKAQPMFPARP